MPPSPYLTIPPLFTTKKAAILASLCTPTETYTDLSPKGSVDTAIKDLIDRINTLEGIVTTSSCAGRVSVFLEGRKREGERLKDGVRGDGVEDGQGQVAVPGGKGMGGRWLFVSHEPVDVQGFGGSLSGLLGLEAVRGGRAPVVDGESRELRLARFQFEPMILHIMAASLHHVQPILTAAINAGFRESGVQSLKNLDDANSFPMVAIRSSGLALESIVGVISEKGGNDTCHADQNDDCKKVDSIVTEEYLELLVNLANERFTTNTERVERFESGLFRQEARRCMAWEDREARKERKRAEGLEKQDSSRRKTIMQEKDQAVQTAVVDNIDRENDALLESLSISQ